VAALAGVKSAAMMSSMEGRGRNDFEIRGEKVSAGYVVAQPGYFATLGIRLRRGRVLR